jgi:hypothetical protein
MTQAYPIHVTREIDRRWQRRRNAAIPPLSCNDNNNNNSRRCSACDAPTSTAPICSEYRDGGVVLHHWLCRACGYESIVVLHA